MTPQQKRALFPLRGPRWQSLAFLPLDIACAAIGGYHWAFFACLPGYLPRRRK